MSDVKAGGAYVELSLQSDKFQKGLVLAERRLTQIGSSIANVGKYFAAVGTAGVIGFLPMIKAASDAQEQMSKFDTVFGDASEEMKRFAESLANELGRGSNEIAKFMASSQDLFVPLGFDKQAATELTKTITRLAVDLGSFNNLADADVLNDLQAALTGSGEVMKKYGVLVNEAAVKQKLLNDSIDPTVATEQQKVMSRLSIILAGTSAAQGDATRTASGFANQVKRLQGVLADVAVEVGNALLPGLTKIVTAINMNIGGVKKFISENQKLIAIIFAGAAGLAAFGGALIAIGAAVSGAGIAIGLLLKPLAAIATVFGAIIPLIGALITPMGLLVAGVTALGVAIASKLGVATKVFDYLRERIGTLVGDFREAIAAIAQTLQSGDIAAAGKILWLTLRLEWDKGITALNAKWIEWKLFFTRVWTEAVYSLAGTFIEATAGLEAAWIHVTDFFADTWAITVASVKSTWLTAQQAIATGILKLAGLMDSEFDVSGSIRELNADFAKQQQQVAAVRDQGIGERDKARQQRLKELDQQEQATIDALEADRKVRVAEIDAAEIDSLKKTQQELVQARADWSKAIAAASGVAKQAQEANQDGNPLDKFLASLQGAEDGIAAAGTDRITQRTLTGGERAGQVFGVDSSAVQKQQLQKLAVIADEGKRTRQAIERGRMVFAP